MVRFSIVVEGDCDDFDTYVALARLAEEAGFHSFQVYEHIGFRPSWSILFSVARSTNKIFMGPVTVPVLLQHPLYLSSNLATLNEVTGGREMLGVSRGAFYERLGVGPQSAPDSREAVSECVAIVNSLVTSGKLEEGFDGRFFRVPKGTSFEWTYARRSGEGRSGKVPIYVGTSGPKMVSKAVSLGAVSGVVTDNLWNPEYFRRMRSWIDGACEQFHRSSKEFELVPRPFCSIAESHGEAVTEAKKSLRRYMPHLMGRSGMMESAGLDYSEVLRFAEESEVQDDNALGQSKTQLMVENFTACGTPHEISNQIEEMIRAGAEHICFGYPLGKDPVAALKLITSRVTPRFT
ncbi:MAG TPA: LLM class flavin-dependent oxidoreductase [Nitrososphaerales archaeon]|nr:LLM class flavin-dependent oxidoreductase [Nitrososphaerales archaeon]